MNLRSLLLLIVPFLLLRGTAAASTAEAEKRLTSAVTEVLAAADRASSNSALATTYNGPAGSVGAWRVTAFEVLPFGNWTLSSYAICIRN